MICFWPSSDIVDHLWAGWLLSDEESRLLFFMSSGDAPVSSEFDLSLTDLLPLLPFDICFFPSVNGRQLFGVSLFFINDSQSCLLFTFYLY